jgi:hypothetical protein
MLNSLYFINALNGRDVINDGLQLSEGMNSKGDGTVHNTINRLRCQFIYRQAQLISNAVNHVAQQMESVNCHYLYADRIEYLLILQEVHRHNGIALLGSNLYG